MTQLIDRTKVSPSNYGKYKLETEKESHCHRIYICYHNNNEFAEPVWMKSILQLCRYHRERLDSLIFDLNKFCLSSIYHKGTCQSWFWHVFYKLRLTYNVAMNGKRGLLLCIASPNAVHDGQRQPPVPGFFSLSLSKLLDGLDTGSPHPAHIFSQKIISICLRFDKVR